MNYFSDAFSHAVSLIVHLDPALSRIVLTSVAISLSATLFAAILAIPTGVWVAIHTFPGRALLQHGLNTLAAMPTVVIGLLLYGLLSRAGPLGSWHLLYTPYAIVIAETILIIPIMMNLTIAAVRSADSRLLPTLISLGARSFSLVKLIIQNTRFAMLAALVTGFGRAIGEVGAAMMLGGNIAGLTRTMTTAIALETSKGAFELGLALGLILLTIALILSLCLSWLNGAQSHD